jgi:hypothetical protein
MAIAIGYNVKTESQLQPIAHGPLHHPMNNVPVLIAASPQLADRCGPNSPPTIPAGPFALPPLAARMTFGDASMGTPLCRAVDRRLHQGLQPVSRPA